MTDNIKQRLEYLRGEIEAERISQGELLELQGLAAHIEDGDVLLLEWAGVPEHAEDRCSECGASLEDNEGYDGLCGNHADKAEREGRWS